MDDLKDEEMEFDEPEEETDGEPDMEGICQNCFKGCKKSDTFCSPVCAKEFGEDLDSEGDEFDEDIDEEDLN